MFLKLMDQTGGSRIIEVAECAFHRLPEPHVVYRVTPVSDPITLPISVTAYLMNGNGNTIDKISPR